MGLKESISIIDLWASMCIMEEQSWLSVPFEDEYDIIFNWECKG